MSSRRQASGAAALTLGALGVVFGDIGTSPLYAVQAVFATHGHTAVAPSQSEVYGVISLVFWSITMLVSVKYVTFIMRADNEGEGGIIALTALVQGLRFNHRRTKAVLVLLGILGASLFYGDGMITPAISVLSAVEGVKVAAPGLSSLVVPITVVVIAGLFAVQHFGTQRVGALFGPVMIVWFSVLAALGVSQLAKDPGAFRALSPTYGAAFFVDHGAVAFIALGSVVLAVTGAEALYADMGHFGRRPIRRAWFLLAFPALTLNYLAQGSLIVRDPHTMSNPFFILVPSWARIAVVLLATAATVIASQSVISGAFSLTHQAVQLGFLPRMRIRQTSEKAIGQVYAPAVNRGLCVAVIVLVIGFGSSAALASAYGVAVTGTFILNTILFLAVARSMWKTSRRLIACGAVVFLSIEGTFFAANLTKIPHGGWLPLLIALIVFTVLSTWRKGSEIVSVKRERQEGSLDTFVAELDARVPALTRVPGTAVFLNSHPLTTPLALRANVEHNHVLHENIVIITIEYERVPHIADADRVSSDDLGDPGDGLTRITAHYGFQDDIDVPAVLRQADRQQMLEGDCQFASATYFLSQITIVSSGTEGMNRWRTRLFLALAHNAADPVEYFKLPDHGTLSIGERIEL
jgi:KUP system potassium uptake protein